MGVEIEKKFLLQNEKWRSLSEKGHVIKQGYLSTEKERTVRVRLFDETGYLTIKGKSVGNSRLEFEYEIPKEDALQLLSLCKKPIIEKSRHKIKFGNHIWEVDEFEGVNEGLIVAEIELESENENFEIPDWIGKEVSDDVRYFNANLIQHPFKDW